MNSVKQISINTGFIIRKSFYFIPVILLFSYCNEFPHKPGSPYNPYDLNNPNYIPPQVFITSGPDSNSIVFADEVTFTWIGNLDNMEFRYRLYDSDSSQDNDTAFSPFAETNTVSYAGLDELLQKFEIQGRYISGAVGQIKRIPFTVNAIAGPALLLKPRNIELLQSNQTFEFDLWVDDTDPIAGINVELEYNPLHIQIYDVDFLVENQESFLLENGGELISFFENDTINGIISMDCAVVTGDPREVSGSGKIAKIFARHLTGTNTNVTISNQSKFRNSNNEDIPIINLSNTHIFLIGSG